MKIQPSLDAALQELLPVPGPEAQRFAEARLQVAARMDRCVFQRPDLGLILGDVAPSTVREMHRQHAAFMAAVHHLGVPELLADGLPALYRSYVGRGLPAEYLEVAPDLWSEAVDEELGASTPAVSRVHRWLAHHKALWHSALRTPSAALDPASPAGRLCRALVQSDPTGARGTVRGELRQSGDLAAVFAEVISPALNEIGRLWETGAISVAQEHVASAMVARLLAELSQDLPGAGQRMAVVSAAPDDPHEFGAWIVADLLRSGGWEVRFLGSSIPGDEILGYVEGTGPDLLAMSCTLPVYLPGLQELIGRLRADAGTAHVPVLVGGQAFRPGEAVWRVTGADGFARDAAGILSAANALVGDAGTKPPGQSAVPRA